MRGMLNTMLPNPVLKSACSLDGPTARLIGDAVDRGGMSARGVHRALRVARTIADLAGVRSITATHLAEALQYRAYESRRVRG